MHKVYAIGPLPIEGDVIGGTKVSFDNLVKALKLDDQIQLTVLNSSRPLKNKKAFQRLFLNLGAIFKVLFSSAIASIKYDTIIWNVSSTALPLTGIFFWLSTRIGRAKIIIRVFGGDLEEVVRCQHPWLRRLMLFAVFKFDAVLLQTKWLVNHFNKFGRNIYWFPTTRNFLHKKEFSDKRCLNFIYIGQLRREKGIPEIIAAARKLDSRVNIAICGPLMPGYNPIEEIIDAGIKYIEPISNSQVSTLLSEYDALLFPSFWREGYPGVVIESLQSGLPVIASNCKSLQEIIIHDENGILIKPGSSGDLVQAMARLQSDSAYFQSLCKGAVRSGQLFSSTSAVDRLKNIIFQLNLQK